MAVVNRLRVADTVKQNANRSGILRRGVLSGDNDFRITKWLAKYEKGQPFLFAKKMMI
jgi:hypothetical protein